MAHVVQAKCPGCQTVLRIPSDWTQGAVRCLNCNLVVKTSRKPVHHRSSGGIWKPVLVGTCVLGLLAVVAGAGYAVLPQIKRAKAPAKAETASVVSKSEAASPAERPAAAKPAEERASENKPAANSKKDKKPETVAAANALPNSEGRIATTPPTQAPKSGTKLEAQALARWIDWQIQQRLDAEKVTASARADDAEFLRRVYLDIAGAIPPADKAIAFLDSQDPNKRAKLVDELLATPQYGRHLADVWQLLLVEKTSDNRRLQTQPLHNWLEETFNKNLAWDKMTSELITASGPQDKNGAITFFVSNSTPDKVTDRVARLFLGVQLQCAQCHNHPFTGWKQTEYWGMAGFFTKVKMGGADKKAMKAGTTPSVSEEGKGKQAKLPDSAKKVSPKFLQAEEPKLNPNEPYRPVLAKWLTSSKNPYFAKAMVNRMWALYFGRGLVNPVDDMHEGNKPSHPELLQGLADQFTANQFDLKYLIRAITLSETYQRTSKPNPANHEDTTLFSHMAIKVMLPEQLYDSLEQVLGKAERGRQGPRVGAQRGGPSGPREAFLNFFRTEDGDPTEYAAGIPQALRLMNSPQMNNSSALLSEVTKAGTTPAQNIEKMYLATLARRPNAHEVNRLSDHVAKNSSDARKAYGDILWAILNSSEFTLNH